MPNKAQPVLAVIALHAFEPPPVRTREWWEKPDLNHPDKGHIVVPDFKCNKYTKKKKA